MKQLKCSCKEGYSNQTKVKFIYNCENERNKISESRVPRMWSVQVSDKSSTAMKVIVESKQQGSKLKNFFLSKSLTKQKENKGLCSSVFAR